MVGQLKGLGKNRTGRGRTEGIPRLYFVIRLGEVFALSTGIVPTFHFSEKGNRSGKYAPPAWIRFLECAFNVIGFPVSAYRIDSVLRHIAEAMPTHRNRIEAFARWRRRRIVLGEFQSEGIVIDWLRGENRRLRGVNFA
jgi:hypothetical protein